MGVVSIEHPVGRRAFFALLYFSEGAPIGYIWWAMPTRLRKAGMPVEQVSVLIGLLALPWAFKFLWAPAVDRFRGRRWGYRSWITVTQVVMGLSLLPLGFGGAETFTRVAWVLLLVHAFAASTQDVAIDALAISTIPEAERGRITSWMQAGMLVGRAIFGGLALAAESVVGAEGVVFALVGCVWFSLAVLWLMPGVGGGGPATHAARSRPIGQALLRAARRPSTWLGLGIALTAGAGFEAVGGLVGPLLSDHWATQGSIGWFLAIPVVSLMIVGGLLGGFVADRLGHRAVVAVSVYLVAACVLSLIAAESIEDVAPIWLMVAAGPMYLFLGSLTASSYALFMDLTDPAIGGTQFSVFMGATNLCEVWAVTLAGKLAGIGGYGLGFAVPAAVSLCAIPLALMLRRFEESDKSP